MLKVRVIPTMLWNDLGLVKGKKFDSWRRVGTVLPAIKIYNARDVDELLLLDIVANKKLYEPDYESLNEFTNFCFVPFAFGGGIKGPDQIQKLLSVGADKVCLNTINYVSPKVIEDAAKKFGSQCLIASVDVKLIENEYRCFSHSGTKCTNKKLEHYIKELEDRGAGEVLITSIDKDGTMEGYDIELISAVSSKISIPVIASGGAGEYQDMEKAIKEGGASAVAAASMFHFTEKTPDQAKLYLKNRGIPVRIPLDNK